MKPTIVITPAAELDIAEAIAWYEAISPGLPSLFRLALETSLTLIAEYPDSYMPVTRGLRRKLLDGFPYGIFYLLEPSLIRVLAVLHTRRDPGEITSRGH